jgi:hypothetical protein
MRFFTVIFIFFLSFSLFAQNLQEAEKELFALFETLKMTSEKEEIYAINTEIETTLQEALKNPDSFNFPFESLNFLGKIYSDDNLLRIYTWNIPLKDNTHTYGGIIQQKNNNKRTVLKLKDPAYIPPTDKYLYANNWYGALYYRAIPVTHKKQTYYTLLGWIGNDDLTTVKLIDVLTFDDKGKAKLGLPVFKKQTGKTQLRVIFEYGNEYTMTVDYDKKSKQIIFDHLSPSQKKYEGIFSHYGPDFTYDSFQLKKKDWIYKENIDARNKE